jgi:hypothetical protein
LSEIKNLGQLQQYGNGYYRIDRIWWKNLTNTMF